MAEKLSDIVARFVCEHGRKVVAGELAEQLDRSLDSMQKRVSACMRKHHGEQWNAAELDVIFTLARRERATPFWAELSVHYLLKIDYSSREASELTCNKQLERASDALQKAMEQLQQIRNRADELGED